jgi:hypothetical protein
MVAFDQPVEPLCPVWRLNCWCSFKAGRPGEIAACKCRYWWRVSKRGRWYAVSKRRAFRVLLPDLVRELCCFEMTGAWPRD